jgi:hypothetical protein
MSLTIPAGQKIGSAAYFMIGYLESASEKGLLIDPDDLLRAVADEYGLPRRIAKGTEAVIPRCPC